LRAWNTPAAKNKRAADLSPAALVVDETSVQLHAHLETAGASKKAKAKKEKEAEAVVGCLHLCFISRESPESQGWRDLRRVERLFGARIGH